MRAAGDAASCGCARRVHLLRVQREDEGRKGEEDCGEVDREADDVQRRRAVLWLAEIVDNQREEPAHHER